MKFSVAALALLAALTEARPQFTNSEYSVQAGVPFTLKWADAVGKVTITLKNGNSGNLKTVEVIDSDDSGSSFTWTPPTSLPSDTYAFEISDESGDEPNYSAQFTFAGSASASASTTGASSTGSATSSTASSSASASSTTSSAVSSTTTSSVTSSSSSSITSSSTSSANSTTLTTTTSSTSSSTSSSATAASTTDSNPVNTNDSKRLGSPLAFVLVTLATLLYFN